MTSLPIDNPFLEWLGVMVTEWSPEYVEMRLPITSNLSNGTDRVQGGVHCTLLDAVAGYSGLYTPSSALPLQSVTLSLTTNFIDSGDGDVLVAKGYLERRGRSIYFARGEVWLDGSLLVAAAVGTFKYSSAR